MTAARDTTAIRSLLYRLAECYGRLDADEIIGFLVDETPSFIGTGAHELAFGTEAIRTMLANELGEADDLAMTMDEVRVDVFGDSAFAYTEPVIHATFGGDTFNFPVRTSYGMTRTQDGWRIAQVHTSVPEAGLPEGRAFPVKLTKTLSDLLTSIDNATGSPVLKAKDLGTTTVLFTDIVDSTVHSQSMGDEAWSRVIDEHFAAVEEIVESEGGTVVKTLGDGGMYVFPSGTSALLSAIQIQKRVTSHDDRRISLRVGVHTGDVVQGRGDFIGLTVNKAARVAAAAEGDQILVSATTADVVNHADLRLTEPITVELKGITGTHTLLNLEWSTI